MSSRHTCLWCDYARDADHVAVLDPACPQCGGQLGLEQPTADPVLGAPRIVALAKTRWVERGLIAVVVLPLMAAAAKVGWSSAGPAAAAGALCVALLVAYVALAPATRHR